MTTLNTLTVINAAQKSGLFDVMNAIKDEAPEVAGFMLANCTQHFNTALAHIAAGADEKTIGAEFGCGEIDAFELFSTVANQASEDLQIYIQKRDVPPIDIVAGQVEMGDRLLNAFTGDYEVILSTYNDLNHNITIQTDKGTKITLSLHVGVTIKR